MVVFTFSGCVPRISHYVTPDYKERMPTSIAVLPVQNETVDMDAPKVFRPWLVDMVTHKGYLSPQAAVIDSKLLERDIREAGQLGSMTPHEIGELLSVDAVLYTTVTEWSTTYLVNYASINVGARFQIFDTRTGQELWKSEHEVAERKFSLDEDAIEEILTFALLRRYDPYVKKLINAAFSTLPNGYRHIPPGKYRRHIPREVRDRLICPFSLHPFTGEGGCSVCSFTFLEDWRLYTRRGVCYDKQEDGDEGKTYLHSFNYPFSSQ